MNTSVIIRLLCAVLFLVVLPITGHTLTPAQIFNKVKNSIVVVKTLDAQGKVKSQGSGVLLSLGRVATNCHVVEGGVSYQVGRGNRLVSATLYAEDGDKDVCILAAQGIAGKPAQLGKAAGLKVGEPVYAVGAPKGLELSMSDGIVGQLRGGLPPFIQTTAAISPGSSGGGLFDKEGRLVGLTTFAVKDGQNLNFAMPVEWIGEVKPGRKQVVKGIGRTEWLKRALALEHGKNWHGMLDWCRKWTENDPKDASAWNGLGVAYGNLSRYDDAIEAFRQALSIDPNDAKTWNNLGNTQTALSRYDDAIEAFRQALQIDPELAIAWYNLGIAYRKFNRYDDAIDAYRQALSFDPKHASAWNGLGVAYGSLNRYDDAIEAFRQALQIDPKDGSSWRNLGAVYGSLRRYDDAIDAARQALLIDPKDVIAWLNLGVDYGKLSRYNDAIDALRHALRIDPKYADALYNLGVAYHLSGNRTAALDAVPELRRLDPKKADKLFNLIAPR